jgi:hypothetical protein
LLPTGCQLRDVFHVSQLKKYLGSFWCTKPRLTTGWW